MKKSSETSAADMSTLPTYLSTIPDFVHKCGDNEHDDNEHDDNEHDEKDSHENPPIDDVNISIDVAG